MKKCDCSAAPDPSLARLHTMECKKYQELESENARLRVALEIARELADELDNDSIYETGSPHPVAQKFFQALRGEVRG